MADEIFDIVNESGEIVGSATRDECHGNPKLLHSVVHLLVFDSENRVLLQFRAKNKKIQPARWDTSVGGHIHQGETVEEALHREVLEEIGLDLTKVEAKFAYQYTMRNQIESELIRTFICRSEGPFQHQETEIDKLRFFSFEEIDAMLGTGICTPNFENEYQRVRLYLKE